MTQYDRGRRFEYSVRDRLKKKGFHVFRSAGSRGIADLVALKAGEVWLVECKLDGVMSPIERIGLIDIAKELGVVPMLAKKLAGHVWFECLDSTLWKVTDGH